MSDIRSTAAFSSCGQYRWWLARCWDPLAPRLIFIGLNPSRADGQRDDPTLRRLLGFGRRWGFGALEVLNLFARISPSPAMLRRLAEPVGAGTDAWIQQRLRATPELQTTLWLGWGNQGSWRGRDRAVLALLQGRDLWALGLTAAGQPRHPLYAASAASLQSLAWRNPEPLVHPVGTPVLLLAAPPPPCPAPHAATPSTCT